MARRSPSHPVFVLAGSALGGQAGPVTDVFPEGSCQVLCGPEGGVPPGAGFRVADLAFRSPGFLEEGLAPGHHRLRFAPVAGFTEPPEEDLFVAGGASRRIEAEYDPLQSFYFRSIPPLTAREGTLAAWPARAMPETPRARRPERR